jgi:hypothetical protein
MEAHNTYPKLTDEEYIVFERNCPLAIKRREHINFIDKIRRAFNLSPGESLGDFDRRSFKGKWRKTKTMNGLMRNTKNLKVI